MGDIAGKISLLLQTKANIKAALIEKGQDVTDKTPFSGYADKIRAISTGDAPSPQWGMATLPATPVYPCIAFGDGVFVASLVGNNMAFSDNHGMAWTPVTFPSTRPKTIAFGDGVFVAVSDSNTENTIYRSTDKGKTWQKSEVQLPNVANSRSVAYGNGVFVLIDQNGSVYRSVDRGITWQASVSPLSSELGWRGLAFGDGVFSAISYEGKAAYSIDNGVTWQESADAFPGSAWTNIAFGDGVFVAVIYGGSKAAYSTDKGASWTVVTLPNGQWCSLAFGHGVFIAVGNKGKVAYSTDKGTTWKESQIESTANWPKVAFGNGSFVVLLGDGSNQTAYAAATDFLP